MTATQMSYEFDVGYDKITNFDAPGYEPKEKSTFLTKAQEEIVMRMLSENPYQEFNKRIIDVLKTSETVLAAAMGTGPYNNSFRVDLDSLTAGLPVKIINERATLTPTLSHFYTGQVFRDVKVKPIDDDYYHANIKNPFKKPSHELVWRLDYGENDSGWKQRAVYIIEDNEVLTSVTLHFYRKPSPIIIGDTDYAGDTTYIDGVLWSDHDGGAVDDLNCELNEIVHRTIVDKAIKLAYAALQDEKGFQLSSTKEQIK